MMFVHFELKKSLIYIFIRLMAQSSIFFTKWKHLSHLFFIYILFQDLEETICTMKEQIVILKSRADILQEELQSFTSTTTVTNTTAISWYSTLSNLVKEIGIMRLTTGYPRKKILYWLRGWSFCKVFWH